MKFTPEHEQIADTVRKFVAKEINPHLPEWEAAGQFRDGRLVYGQAKSDQTIVIDPDGAADEIHPNIVISTTAESPS